MFYYVRNFIDILHSGNVNQTQLNDKNKIIFITKKRISISRIHPRHAFPMKSIQSFFKLSRK
ncbi:hypothetical protein HanIR_Chr11g0552461 [Helianthus annuus]|nr:hypothetical protein HanIR_Chr11g0552461 [Helianthus annuus]